MIRRAFTWAFGERGEGLALGAAVLATVAFYAVVVAAALALACAALWLASVVLKMVFR